MAAGTTRGFLGNLAPLEGEMEFTQKVAATDHMTLTAAAGASGKSLTIRNSSLVSKFTVDASGNVVAAGTLSATGGLSVANIGTITHPAAIAGATTSYAIAALTSNDVVIISPQGAPASAVVVERVQAGTLRLTNVASEAASFVVNYAIVAKGT